MLALPRHPDGGAWPLLPLPPQDFRQRLLLHRFPVQRHRRPPGKVTLRPARPAATKKR